MNRIPNFVPGDRVSVQTGTFEGRQGVVEENLYHKHAVRVVIEIFGRPVPVELEYWDVELVPESN